MIAIDRFYAFEWSQSLMLAAMDALPRLPFDIITIIAEYADPCTQARLAQTCTRLRDQIYSGQYGADGPKLRHYNFVPGMITTGSSCVHATYGATIRYAMPNGRVLCKIMKTPCFWGSSPVYKRFFYLTNVLIVEEWTCIKTTVRTSCTSDEDFYNCKLINTFIHDMRSIKRVSEAAWETPPLKRSAASVEVDDIYDEDFEL